MRTVLGKMRPVEYGMNQKRVNFNMQEHCHALLKSVCALKGITVSEYVYGLVSEDFRILLESDNQVQTMFLNGTYREGTKAYILKQSLIEELNKSNDSFA